MYITMLRTELEYFNFIELYIVIYSICWNILEI